MGQELESYSEDELFFSVQFDTEDAKDVRYLCDGVCIDLGEVKLTYYDGFAGRMVRKFKLKDISNLQIERVTGFKLLEDADIPIYYMKPQRQH